jgi:hypothetical protein
MKKMAERLRFERELQDLEVREYDQGQAAQKATVAVGQPIHLDLANFGFAGAVIDYVYWEVPGETVKTYWGDRKGSEVTRLLPADRQKNPLSFYWVDADDNRRIRCVAGGRRGPFELKKDFSLWYDVKGPTLDYFKAAKINPVRVRVEGGVSVVRFGSLDKNAPGIKWDWQVTMPAGFGGWIKDLQTIVVRQEETRLIGGARKKYARRHPTKAAYEQLDQSPFDKGTEASYSGSKLYGAIDFPAAVKAAQAFRDDETWDSPGTAPDRRAITASVNNDFTYYILFKPFTMSADKGSPIWVPIARAEWCWKAEAVKRGGKWVLTSKEGKVEADRAAAVDFPVYHSNVNENKWVEVT